MLIRSMCVALIAVVTPSSVLAQLEWRVSVKFILNDEGVRPGEVGNPDPNCESLDGSVISCASEVHEKFDFANAALGALGRGYRFRVTEIANVGGLEDYFDCADCEGNGGYDSVRAEVDDLVRSDPERFHFRDDALNIYIHNRDIGGRSATRNPGAPAPVVLIGQKQGGGFVRPFHEMGHALGLCHTHGECANCNEASDDGDCEVLGDDCIDDTLPDNQRCGGDNELALHHFGRPYVELSCSERKQIIDVLFNVMSYHKDDGWESRCDAADFVPVDCSALSPPDVCRHRLSSDQLDRIADRSNAFWPQIVNGRTVFVDDDSPSWFPDGSSTEPFPEFEDGLDAADSGDIVLMRSGSYFTTRALLDQRVTLRASRGNAIIER